MQNVFLPDLIAKTVPTTLQTAEDQLINGDLYTFLSIWTNATSPPSSSWNGMIVSYQGTPTGISRQSATMLWDSSDSNSFLGQSQASIKRWQNAGNGSADDFNFLANHFMLQPSQLQAILDWIANQFNPLWTIPVICSTFKVQQIQDLMYVQWGQGTVTNGISLKDLYPDQHFAIQPGRK